MPSILDKTGKKKNVKRGDNVKFLWKKKKDSQLTEYNYFFANNPEYLNNNPEIKRKLIESEKKHKPDDCFRCIFLAHKDEGERVRRYFCPLNDVDIELDKRPDGCVLDA